MGVKTMIENNLHDMIHGFFKGYDLVQRMRVKKSHNVVCLMFKNVLIIMVIF